MSDLWVMVEAIQIDYPSNCAIVIYDHKMYSVSLDDPIEDIGVPWIQVPTYVLKPREHYFNIEIAKMIERVQV